MKYITTILFVIMLLAQWIVPGKMIYDSENVIFKGAVYKFKTQPIDPSDPFRGNYITLSFEANVIKDTTRYEPGEVVHVTFLADSAGYALASTISRKTPASGPYLQTTVRYTSGSSLSLVYFALPFDRFYMEESKASEAERAYWQANTDSVQVAYGVVSMGNGVAVLTDVMINDKSVRNLVKELNVQE
ncbi:MAG: GDYXXLXY domain-containing protein [Chryseolinea sp.]